MQNKITLYHSKSQVLKHCLKPLCACSASATMWLEISMQVLWTFAGEMLRMSGVALLVGYGGRFFGLFG